MTTGFVDADRADVTVVVVTYRSGAGVADLLDSLRDESRLLALHVVVVDNDSTDDTVDVVRTFPDVELIDAGGNTGYAAAVNRGTARAEAASAVLILNPDAVVAPGCVGALLAALREPGVVAVVPSLIDASGTVSHSLRREPRLVATAVDAAVGHHLPHRPRWSSETIRDSLAYSISHDIEWATGAAVMIDAAVARATGPWDEGFFLYSEETDYFRRLRRLGRVRFVPEAVVTHLGGGSGTSQHLQDLLTVNRIRYAEKHHGRAWAALFRGLVVTSELARSYSPRHRATLRVVLDRARWERLPRAQRRALTPGAGSGTVVIPAHDEAAVLATTLAPLSELARTGTIEVIVACNGCTDGTADIARSVPGITVVDTGAASKTGALNAADGTALFWPRMYLDADIVVTPRAVLDVLAALRGGGGDVGDVLAARPPFVYDTRHASFLVRRFYAARSRVPDFSRHLWGAGCYALGEVGHRRLGRFPDVVADDVVVDGLFAATEKTVVDTDPVVVAVPRTVRALVAVLSRSLRGNAAVPRTTDARSSLATLARSVRGPVSAVDAAVYVALATAGRVAARRDRGWVRDETNRG
ncbi:glycosyltransferase family 2 protein [Rhodococcoides kroppenstedtii]|uniref:glycosyltransferase family 2 protein n=1 Tax=Rhodococcoides kroppenstedtii TaxID=293050 RepID=UPI0028EC671B|nr:glycosyltransferase family 2 protein [Rhodococcus kroppenstedtii]